MIGYCEWTDELCRLVMVFIFAVFLHFILTTIWWIKMTYRICL